MEPIPVSAVFIGSNFALAAVNYYGKVIAYCSEKLKTLLIMLPICASILCIFCSELMPFVSSIGEQLYHLSLLFLLITYFCLLFFSYYETSKYYKQVVDQQERLKDDRDATLK